MRISSSDITMSSSSISTEKYTREENLKTWAGNRTPDPEQQSQAQIPGMPDDTLQISQQGKTMQLQNKDSTDKVEDDNYITFELSEKDKQKILLIEKLFEALTGKKIKLHTLEKIKIDKQQNHSNPASAKMNPPGSDNSGWGIIYNSHESYYESEKMSFNSEGIIKTADGKEINFSVSLNMSREFYSEQNINFRAGDAVKVDPLVINFGGNTTGLTDTKFSFDLDSNGKSDQISFVTQGSGFLSLDLNNDGVINNGSELFGPNSGNGFGELAAYDSDGNNWIDENDPIYDKLRIWTKDENGNDTLFALGQKGIGAIYLGNIDTSFNLKNQSNESNGQIQKSGIYVKEDNSVGIIHHIDLAI